MRTNTQPNNQKGISLVIALIMMTVLLSVSFSIGNIILRQLRLTNIGTNSQTSFYAADSALECALYWDTLTDGTIEGDFESSIFGTSTPISYAPLTNPIKCGDNTSNPLLFAKVVDPTTDTATTTFNIDFGAGSCAHVEVVKTPYRTQILSSGYNTTAAPATEECVLTDAVAQRIVERSLIFTH